MDPLLEINNHNQVIPCIAEEYGTDDNGLTWTFKIREGVKWVDMNGNEMADLTAQDFLTAMEWTFNFHKNSGVLGANLTSILDGASEYYEYTKSLSTEEAYALTAGEGSVFRDTVKIEVPDDYTLIFHCLNNIPYFDDLAVNMYPLSQQLVDALGGPDGVQAMNNENMWYNGCYTMTSYVQGNEKTLTKNPAYWDKDCKLFDTVTIKIVDSTDTAYQLYQSGEIDQVSLYESTIQTILDDPNHEYHDSMIPLQPTRSYSIRFNFDKYKEDGTPDTNWNTAAANKAFRLSIYYGLDLTNYYSRLNPLDPLSCENEYYTMKGLAYTSDGTDYTELVRQELGLPELNGEQIVRLDPEKAEQYKQQAIEELTALGVTFPVEMDLYITANNQTVMDHARVLQQVYSDCFGDDYIKLNIKSYVSNLISEVLTPKLHSFYEDSWVPDYGDPKTFLDQEVMGSDSAFYSNILTNINSVEESEATKDLLETYRTFTEMVDQASQIYDDNDKRLQAFAEAEAYMIENALVIPSYYPVSLCLTKVDPYSTVNAIFAWQNGKMKNWQTNADGYTTEQIEAIKAEYEAAQ
jgi:oligopeptide transport system substrate-binding protein